MRRCFDFAMDVICSAPSVDMLSALSAHDDPRIAFDFTRFLPSEGILAEKVLGTFSLM